MNDIDFDIPEFEMPDFDFGGIDVDIDLSQFNLVGGYDEETVAILNQSSAIANLPDWTITPHKMVQSLEWELRSFHLNCESKKCLKLSTFKHSAYSWKASRKFCLASVGLSPDDVKSKVYFIA